MLIINILDAGIAQLARASAFQAEGREFESRFPLHGIFFLGADVKFYFLILHIVDSRCRIKSQTLIDNYAHMAQG